MKMHLKSQRASNSHGDFSNLQIVGLVIILIGLFTSLYFMRYLEDLSQASRLIIGGMASLTMIYLIWMLNSVCKK